MFTGLIQQVGRVLRWERREGGARLSVRHEPWKAPLEVGESVAVQGACLTAAEIGDGWFRCDVLAETLARTNLQDRPPGAAVNLERSLRFGDLLGGHLVSGHVDGKGHVLRLDRHGSDWALIVECSGELLRGIVVKGSIACDGVSLTVAELASDSFTVAVIPHTWQHTSLRELGVGDAVNLELDMIGKYVYRYLAVQRPSKGIHMDDLRNAGFPV